MVGLLLVLTLTQSADAGPTPALTASLSLRCENCFGLDATLDGQDLLAVQGLGAVAVDAANKKVDAGKSPRFANVRPGRHALRVELRKGPLDARVIYDGPVFLRPGSETAFTVDELGLHAAPGSEPPRDTAITLERVGDGACALWLDDAALLTVDHAALVRAPGLRPGLHRVQVRDAAGKALAAGTLFLGAGEDAVLTVRCPTGELSDESDPAAFHAQA